MSARDRYLANADRCFVLADQLPGRETKRSLLQARDSWLLLARLEEAAKARGAHLLAGGRPSEARRPACAKRAAVLR
jgi:hypothetical protein